MNKIIRRVSIVIILVGICILSYAQDRVYITNWASDAHRDMIYVDSPQLADLCINVVYSDSELKFIKPSWKFVDSRSKADIVLRVVSTSNGNRNAVRVYLNKEIRENTASKWLRNYRLFKNLL